MSYPYWAGFEDRPPWWAGLLLVVGGMFASSILIGGSVALLIAGIMTWTGLDHDKHSQVFALGVIVSPVLAFFAGAFAFRYAASF
jgi:hypothetical protein